MTREQILSKYGKVPSQFDDAEEDDFSTIEVDDGKLRISMPDIDSTGMSAGDFAKKMGEHTQAEQETHRKADLAKRMSENPVAPPEGYNRSDYTKGALSKEAAAELADVVRSMSLDNVQKSFDELSADDPIKGKYWENQVENYADTLTTDENREAVVNALKKEIALNQNDFSTIAKLYGPEPEQSVEPPRPKWVDDED